MFPFADIQFEQKDSPDLRELEKGATGIKIGYK